MGAKVQQFFVFWLLVESGALFVAQKSSRAINRLSSNNSLRKRESQTSSLICPTRFEAAIVVGNMLPLLATPVSNTECDFWSLEQHAYSSLRNDLVLFLLEHLCDHKARFTTLNYHRLIPIDRASLLLLYCCLNNWTGIVLKSVVHYNEYVYYYSCLGLCLYTPSPMSAVGSLKCPGVCTFGRWLLWRLLRMPHKGQYKNNGPQVTGRWELSGKRCHEAQDTKLEPFFIFLGFITWCLC